MNSSKTDWPIFTTALLTLAAIAGPLMVWPEAGGRLVDTLYGFLTSQLGVVYIWAGTATLGFVLWLGLGRYGSVVLGTPGAAPSFSTFSWVSMLFCAGVATGILYWGTIEWAHYYVGPPFGVEPRSAKAIEWAATYGMFHWGPTGWAFHSSASSLRRTVVLPPSTTISGRSHSSCRRGFRDAPSSPTTQ